MEDLIPLKVVNAILEHCNYRVVSISLIPNYDNVYKVGLSTGDVINVEYHGNLDYPVFHMPEELVSISLDERKVIYEDARNTWGALAQMEMAQEEATELALAIRKQTRKCTEETYKNMCEETADMEIMIEQLETMHDNFRRKVESFKSEKLLRLEKRIDEDNFNGMAGGGIKRVTEVLKGRNK